MLGIFFKSDPNNNNSLERLTCFIKATFETSRGPWPHPCSRHFHAFDIEGYYVHFSVKRIYRSYGLHFLGV